MCNSSVSNFARQSSLRLNIHIFSPLDSQLPILQCSSLIATLVNDQRKCVFTIYIRMYTRASSLCACARIYLFTREMVLWNIKLIEKKTIKNPIPIGRIFEKCVIYDGSWFPFNIDCWHRFYYLHFIMQLDNFLLPLLKAIEVVVYCQSSAFIKFRILSIAQKCQHTIYNMFFFFFWARNIS